jgi:HSP20 family protein
VDPRSGTASKDKDAKKDKSYRLSERSYGVFYRAIELPAGVDASSIEATMSNGVLKVVVPKPPHAQTKKIEIKEAA